jgi:hypothetical protein
VIDRFAAAGEHPEQPVQWRPKQPAPLPESYLREVDAYLRRVDAGEPTGRARLEQLHPDPPCHTGGGSPTACTRCGGTGTPARRAPLVLGRSWHDGMNVPPDRC